VRSLRDLLDDPGVGKHSQVVAGGTDVLAERLRDGGGGGGLVLAQVPEDLLAQWVREAVLVELPLAAAAIWLAVAVTRDTGRGRPEHARYRDRGRTRLVPAQRPAAGPCGRDAAEHAAEHSAEPGAREPARCPGP